MKTPYDTVHMYQYDASTTATGTRTTSIVFVPIIHRIFILGGGGWSHDIRRSSLSQTTTAITIRTHTATSTSRLSLTHTIYSYLPLARYLFVCLDGLTEEVGRRMNESDLSNDVMKDESL